MVIQSVQHPALGALFYDDRLHEWETQLELFPNCWVMLRLWAWSGTPPRIEVDEILRRGVDFLEWARRAEPLVRQKIADDLFDCYMENWSSKEEVGLGPM